MASTRLVRSPRPLTIGHLVTSVNHDVSAHVGK